MKNFVKRISSISVPLSKRGKFVASVAILSVAFFFSEFLRGGHLIVVGIILSACTVLLLYLSLKRDVVGKTFFPLVILPFFYTLSFTLFYLLVPSRLLTRIILTVVYSFGLYSLFLTQNIFTISSLKTINLLRSARIVSTVITIFVLFFLFNIIFSLRLPVYITPFLVAIISILLCFQSLWQYAVESESMKYVGAFSVTIGIMLGELAIFLSFWPVTAAIYAIFLTGIFYTYSGLLHAWMERRLFKGILWEYAWVGVLSMLFLILFTKWGI